MKTSVPDPTPALEQDPYVTGVDDPYEIVTVVDDPYVYYPCVPSVNYDPVSRNNIGLILQMRVTCTGTSDLPDGDRGAQADKILQGGWLESHCRMACKLIGFAIVCPLSVANHPPPLGCSFIIALCCNI